MCGSDTFAIEVSNTSMNVAKVTVSAITQGLIVPSGILSLDRILSRIAFRSGSGAFRAWYFSSYDRLAPLLYSRSMRDHRRVHVHSGAQHRLRWNRIENNL